jgi:hypothetical protein
VGNDQLHLDVTLKPHSTLLVTTPSHGKVYGHTVGASVAVHQSFVCSPCSLLLFVPSPVSPFRDSSLTSHTAVHLDRSASALLFDGVTSGRTTLGEHFSMTRYTSTTVITATGPASSPPLPLLRDRTVLAPPFAALHRHRVQATLTLIGPHLLPLSVALYRSIQQRTVRSVRRGGVTVSPFTPCLISASWIGGRPPLDGEDEAAAARRLASDDGAEPGGCLVRMMSEEVADLLEEVQRMMAWLNEPLQGVAPWQRDK